MDKKQIEEKTEELLTPLAEAEHLFVYDVDYVKEAGDYYLRCYLDKKDGTVTIDDCVNISRQLSDLLDDRDFISEAYTLEVSSKGLGRTLTNDRQLSFEIGSSIDIKFYKAKNGVKVFTGILTDFDKEVLTVKTEEDTISFDRKEIASVKLTLDL